MLETLLSREVTKNDTFILDFENVRRELNHIAPIISKLKNKGYRWAFWYPNDNPHENFENTLKMLQGDWTGFEHIDSKDLGTWNESLDIVMTNWPGDICKDISSVLRQ